MYLLDDLPPTLRPIAEASVDANVSVVVTDHEQLVVWCNTRFTDLTYINAEEAVGSPLADLRMSDGDARILDRIARRGVVYPDPFGGRIELQSTCVPIFDGGARAGYAFIEAVGASDAEVSRLLSGLQSTSSMLLESQQLYRELFANSGDLIQSADAQGRVLFANEAWSNRLGYTISELAALTVDDFIPAEYVREREIFRCGAEGTQHRVRCELVTRDGGRVWVDGSVTYRFVGERPVGTHAIFRDITEAQRLQRLESEFVAMVNHELRTPLTSIGGAIDLLLDGVAGDLPQKAVEYLSIARRNADRLTTIVTDMLDMQRLSVEQLPLHSADVIAADLVRDVVEEHRGLATRAEVHVEWQADALTITGDEQRLYQVLANLVSNAIHHAHATTIQVSARAAGGVCRFAVADDGDGVAMAFRPHLFERFQQAHSSRNGSGLGLAIVASLAARMGAEAGWCSIEGVGAVFWVDVACETTVGPRTIATGEAQQVLWGVGAHPHAMLDLDGSTADALVAQLSVAGFPRPLQLVGVPEDRFAVYAEHFRVS